ncbi:MAG: GntR family transcriptional regulator [Chloroflexota bacterium]
MHETLRQEILAGVEPGSPLRLSVIAKRLGVSTMPVRWALVRLEREGLVRTIARKGAVVAPLELEDFQEIQAIRWGIEGLAARLGAVAVTDEDLDAMRQHLGDIRTAAGAGDLDAYLSATYALEDTCYAAAGRPRLLAEVRHHRRAAQRYIRFVMGNDPSSLVVGPSEAFYEAAAARDGAEAECCLQHEIDRLFVRLAGRMAGATSTSTSTSTGKERTG